MNVMRIQMVVVNSAPILLDHIPVVVVMATGLLLMDTPAMVYCCILTVIELTSLLNHADINECAEEIDRCAQNCQNTIGSYTCSCNSGYRLGSNGYSCNGIIQNSGGTLIHNYVLLSFHKTLMNVLRTLMDVHRHVQTL